MAIGFQRKINGITYEYDKEFNNKADAKKYGKSLRDKGIRAVVLENPPTYGSGSRTYVVFEGGKK